MTTNDEVTRLRRELADQKRITAACRAAGKTVVEEYQARLDMLTAAVMAYEGVHEELRLWQNRYHSSVETYRDMVTEMSRLRQEVSDLKSERDAWVNVAHEGSNAIQTVLTRTREHDGPLSNYSIPCDYVLTELKEYDAHAE